MPEPDYTASMIKPVQWGKVAQLPGGHWQASWDIELETLDATRLEEVAEAATDAASGFTPRFTVYGETALLVTIETIRWSMEVEYYGLTYTMFRLIDARLGRISLLQGSPRDWWSPFR